jgi:hypothetical protein
MIPAAPSALPGRNQQMGLSQRATAALFSEAIAAIHVAQGRASQKI